MKENILRIFSASASRYFAQAAGQPATIGTPFLLEDDRPSGYDYSAVIGITGHCKGSVIVTAPGPLLTALLPALGETEPNELLSADLVGEITNTIAGNAREELGGGFMISTPVCFRGDPSRIHFPRQTECYVLPIDWQGHRAHLLIALADPSDES